MNQIRRGIVPVLAAAVAIAVSPLSHAEPPGTRKREQIGEVLGKPVYRDELRPKYPSPTEEDELHRLFLDPVLERYVAAHRAELEPTKAELAAVEALLEKGWQGEHVRRAAEIRDSLRLVNKELAKKDSEFKRDYLLQKKQEMEEMLKAELAAKPENPLKDSPFMGELKRVNADLAKPGLTKEERGSLEEAKRDCEAELAHPYRMGAQLLYGNWKWQRHFYDHFGGGRVLWQQAGLEAFDAYRRWIESEEQKGSFRITDRRLRSSFYYYWKRNDGSFITDPDDLRKAFLEPDWVPRTAKR